MALFNQTFNNSIEQLDTSISMIVTIGQHDVNGWPIPMFTFAFGTTQEGLKNTEYNRNMTIYPYLKDGLSVHQSLNIAERRHIISNVSIKLVNNEILSPSNLSGEKYGIISDIFSSSFPNEDNIVGHSVMNEHCVIWLYTSQAETTNDIMPIFRGVITDLSYTKDTLTLKAEDHISKLTSRKIPIGRMPNSSTGVASDGFEWGIDDDQKNIPVPMVLGEIQHAQPVRYHDELSAIEVDPDVGSVGFQSRYLAADRVGRLWPESNIYLLPHVAGVPPLLEYILPNGNETSFIHQGTSNSPDLDYRATPLSVFLNNEWKEVLDIKNAWIGTLYMDTYSFETLDSQEILCTSSWKYDSITTFMLPSSTFANDLIMFLFRQPFERGNWCSARRWGNFTDWDGLWELLGTGWQLEASWNAFTWGGAFDENGNLIVDAYLVVPEEAEQFTGAFNGNQGVFDGYNPTDTSLLGISGAQEVVFSSPWTPDEYELAYYNGFVGVAIDESALEGLDFEQWILIYYFDVAFMTANEDQFDEWINTVLINSDGFGMAGSSSGTACKVRWTSKFKYTDDVISIDNIFEESEMLSGSEFVNGGDVDAVYTGQEFDYIDYWMISDPTFNQSTQAYQDIATDWVRLKSTIIRGEGDEADWKFGIPAGMGFRIGGLPVAIWNNESDYITSTEFVGGAMMRIHDLIIAYILGQEGRYTDLRILSKGRGSGLEAGANGSSLTNPEHSVVSLLEPQNSIINNPVSMIVHILEKEIGFDFNGTLSENITNAYTSHSDPSNFCEDLEHTSGKWKLNLNLIQEESAKDVIEQISKSALVVPIIKTNIDGAFNLNFWFLKEKFENIAHPEVPVFGCNLNYDGVVNYNPYATVNNGSCVDENGDSVILGCTSIATGQFTDIFGFCQVNPSTGYFQLPFNNLDDKGEVIDPDLHWAHGMCFDNPQPNLTHNGLYGYYANNYNPEANIDNGSCFYSDPGGCMDPDANNYDPDAEWDDQSCEYTGLLYASLYGEMVLAFKYYTIDSPDISDCPEIGWLQVSHGTATFNLHAVSYIARDMFNIFKRSWLHFASQMMEWAWVAAGDWTPIANDDIGYLETIFTIQGYQYEIYTHDPEDMGAGNQYWAILKLWGFYPKGKDYVGLDEAILTEATWDAYPWNANDPSDPAQCPGWGIGDGEFSDWWMLCRFLGEMTEDQVGQPAYESQPSYNWPLEYDNPRLFEDLDYGDRNDSIYEAWLFYQNYSGDWDTAISEAPGGIKPAIRWLRYMAREGNDPFKHIIENPQGYYFDDCFLNNLYFSSAVNQGYLFDDEYAYCTSWLRSEQYWYWTVGGGNYTNCQLDGLNNMQQFTISDEWDGGNNHEDLLMEWPLDHTVVTNSTGGWMQHIHKLTYLVLDREGLVEIFEWDNLDESINSLQGLIAMNGGTHYSPWDAGGFLLWEQLHAGGNGASGDMDFFSDSLLTNCTYIAVADTSSPPPYGNQDIDVRNFGTSRTNRIRRLSSSTTYSSRERPDFTTDIDRLIRSKEVINFKIYKSDIKNVASRVKVEYDYDDGGGNYLKSTEWEHWHQLPAIIDNYATTHGESPTGEELLNYYGLDKIGYNDEGLPDIYYSSQLILQVNNTSDQPTAEKIRRANLGLNMNQHTKMDLTLPLKYSNIELGDYVSIDYLIQGKRAYGEDYSLDYYVQTKSEEVPNGIFVVRNGQVIYPLFLVEDIKYSIKDVKIKISQVHDWTGQVISGIPLTHEDTTLGIENGFNGDSFTNYNVHAGGNTFPISENRIGISNKTPFLFYPLHPIGEWTLKIEDGAGAVESIDIYDGVGVIDGCGFVGGAGYTIFENLVSSAAGCYYVFDQPGAYNVWIEYSFLGSDYTTPPMQVAIMEIYDLSLDGSRDILDVVALVGHTVGNVDYGGSTGYTNSYQWQDEGAVPGDSSIKAEAMDGNVDGTANILDIVAFLNIILNP